METTKPSISVSFVNDLKDHLEAQRVIYNEGIFAKGDKVVAVLLVLFGIYTISTVGVVWWAILCFLFAIHSWFNLLSPAQIITTIHYRRNPKFKEEYHVTYSDEGIHFLTASINSEIQWTHYNKVYENPKIFLMMYGKGLYSVTPKRVFQSPAEIQQFQQLLQRHIPDYKVVG